VGLFGLPTVVAAVIVTLIIVNADDGGGGVKVAQSPRPTTVTFIEGGITQVTPPGLRAVSLRIPMTTVAHSPVFPGDFADIQATNYYGGAVTTIAQNVRSYPYRIGKDATPGDVAVTVAVTPERARLLVDAQDKVLSLSPPAASSPIPRPTISY